MIAGVLNHRKSIVLRGTFPEPRSHGKGKRRRSLVAHPSCIHTLTITVGDRRGAFVAGTVSILFHVCLLVLGVAWLVQLARVHVETGKASVEINVTISSAPAPSPVPVPMVSPSPPAPAPPTPRQPVVQRVLPVTPIPITRPVPIPEPLKTQVPAPAMATAKPVASSSPKPIVVSHPTEPSPAVTKSKTARSREMSRASKGAIQAQPDDLHNHPPQYPDESRMAREQGLVILRVQVTAGGQAARVSVLQSSGYFRLDQAASQAVSHWRFEPATVDGLPIASEADVPVRFRLE